MSLQFTTGIVPFIFFVFQSLSHAWLFATPWTIAHQASLSFTVSWHLLKLTSVESVMPSNHLTLCRPLLLPSTFPGNSVFSNVPSMGWGKCVIIAVSYTILALRVHPPPSPAPDKHRCFYCLHGFASSSVSQSWIMQYAALSDRFFHVWVYVLFSGLVVSDSLHPHGL